MLSHILEGIVLFVEHSGLGQLLLFCTITFLCMITSKQGRKVLFAVGAFIGGYCKATAKPQPIRKTWFEQAEEQKMSDTLDIARAINTGQYTTVRIFAPETKSAPWWGLGAESLYE